MNEDVRAQKDALEKLNTQKSTSRRILTGILLKNSALKPNLRSKHLREWSSWLIRSRWTCPKFTFTNVILFVTYDKGIISLAFCFGQNASDIFPNFTRHYLITHTNYLLQVKFMTKTGDPLVSYSLVFPSQSWKHFNSPEKR